MEDKHALPAKKGDQPKRRARSVSHIDDKFLAKLNEQSKRNACFEIEERQIIGITVAVE